MNRVSSVSGGLTLFMLLCCSLAAGAQSVQKKSAAGSPADPQKIFAAGESALRGGNLDEAERDFHRVLALDPGVAGAYANLGVIHMRRKQWPEALQMLRKAEKLAPELAGIRLNIGLVYFRQNNFGAAIKPFESVVKQSPDSFQARYLLGLCYFFQERWADTVAIMEPLWGQASDQMNYLYVLGRAAEKTKNTALEEKAYTRLAEIGQDTPEFHLIMGKAHLNREEYEDAVHELEAAVQGDPKLPFVHFNLGLAYAHKQQFEEAQAEFQKDLALAPDAAFTYEHLADVEATLGNEEEAAKNYREALKRDPLLLKSHMGLAKIEERKQHYPAALAELDEIIRLDPNAANAMYLRGQVLVRMGREKEGRAELAEATKKLNQQRAARQKELEGEPSPELAREPQ